VPRMKSAILEETAHRPWPLPDGPWVMTQTWHDLLFAHWRIRLDALRPLVPRELEIDTFDGSAWIGIVPFRMSGVRVRALPPIPTASAFPELNVRTYVRHGGKSGVFFFSLDATSRLAVIGARLYHMPYFHARMSCTTRGDQLTYSSARIRPPTPPAELKAQYRPIGPVELSERGSLDHWLTERYCLFTFDSRGRLLRGDIHHRPWPLQRAEAHIAQCTMASAAGIRLPASDPHLLFARKLVVLLWPFRHVD
jgi:uncharacterized protein YqjF (DUF2071 family)